VLDICQPEIVATQLDRIVTSPPLASSPSLCRFLRYVVEETLAGRNGSLKEYSLGVVVFDRGDEFDPRLDPIVRVQARNLRVRLAQYYAGAGANDPIVIDLPKRTYVPVFRNQNESAAPEVTEASEPVEVALTVAVGAAPIEVNVEHQVVKAESAPPAVATEAAAPAGAETPAAATGMWQRSRWVPVGIAVILAVLGTSAFWRARPIDKARVALREPDPVAQDLYIRGRYLMDRQTEAAIRESIGTFNSAVQRDPQFAPAYAGLADAYNVLAQYGYISPREGMEQARQAAEKSLQIDPKLAEGHVSLAAIIEAYDWNWAEAEREYRRALELNPNLPEAHLWYGMFLRDQGRLPEALPQLRRAAQLEPFSVFTAVNLAHTYLMAGNFSAAEEQARHAAELSPGMVTPEVLLSSAYRAQSRDAESDEALAKALQFSSGNPHAMSILACALAKHGRRAESLHLFQELESLSKLRYVSPFDMGSVSLVLGDEKRALDLMEEAFRQRSSGLIFLKGARFANWNSSPGFNSLIEKMHFAS